MNEYTVWSADDTDKGDSGLKTISSSSATDAAEEAAEEWWPEWDCPTEMRLCVEDGDGVVVIVVVTVETMPTFDGRLEI